MSKTVKILAFNGSLRADSWNYKLVRVAGQGAEQAGAEVCYLHLNELPMPLFSEELEAEHGMPPNAKKFKELLKAHDGFLIASPEYNSSITAALKNAIDWASRAEPGDPMLAAFKGKTALIMSASPGALGGLRGLVHLRAILGNISVMVLPDQHALIQAHKQFNSDGNLVNKEMQEKIQGLGQRLAEVCAKLV